MKGKIQITALLLLGTAILGFAAYSLVSKKSIYHDPPPEIKQPEKNKINIPEGMLDDFLKLNTAHSLLDNVKITNHYTQVNTLVNNTQKIEEKEFTLCSKGQRLLYDAGSIKRIQDEKYNLLVNDDLHMLIVFDPDKSIGWYMKEALKNIDPDSSLRFADRAEKIKSDSGFTAYAIYYSVMPYSRVDINFSKTTYLLKSITYYYDDFDQDDDFKKQTLTINMSYEKLSASSKSLFDTGNYIEVKRNMIQPTLAYQGYKLYDNMKK